jgi:hypothetical protein
MAGPWEVPELEVRECSPSTLRNVDGGPSRAAGAGGPVAPTINVGKHQRQASWEMLELEI